MKCFNYGRASAGRRFSWQATRARFTREFGRMQAAYYRALWAGWKSVR